MKHLFFLLFLSLLACHRKIPASVSVQQVSEIRKLKWIEGNWRGMYNGKPFYEIYKIKNDSTLEIISYNWSGTDSSETSRSYVYKHEGNYYLGDSLNWKVTIINDSSISMIPNYKANNTIVWKKRDITGWDAILRFSKGERIYNMEKVEHFFVTD